jgi:hypothetical protein
MKSCNATDGGRGGGDFPQHKTLFMGNALLNYACILYVVKRYIKFINLYILGLSYTLDHSTA